MHVFTVYCIIRLVTLFYVSFFLLHFRTYSKEVGLDLPDILASATRLIHNHLPCLTLHGNKTLIHCKLWTWASCSNKECKVVWISWNDRLTWFKRCLWTRGMNWDITWFLEILKLEDMKDLVSEKHPGVQSSIKYSSSILLIKNAIAVRGR